MLPQDLKLKINVPFMFLRNMDSPQLCNYTILLKKKMQNIIETTILNEKFKENFTAHFNASDRYAVQI